MEPEVVKRGPGRPPIHRTDTSPPMRSEEMRTEEPRRRRLKGNIAQDKFAIPAEMIPEGSSYEWKRKTTYGASDPSYDVLMRTQGWLPVDVSRHPDFMPPGWQGSIERDGLILMERPIELTREAQEEERLSARLAVQTKEQQLGVAGSGEFERSNKGTPLVSVKRSVEPMEIPE